MIRGVYRPLKGVEFTDEKKNEKAFDDLKALLVNSITTLNSNDIGTPENLASILADVISLVYKAPMALPLLQYSKNSEYISNNFDYLISYVFNRYYNNFQIDTSDILDEISRKRSKIFTEVFLTSYEEIEYIYEALLTTPADTRPGKNFSSLAAHMNLTALIGWLIFGEAVDIPYYRLAAILHDIGKLVKPEDHITAADQFLTDVINELDKKVDQKIIDYLYKVKDKVIKHHSMDFKPDRIAAKSERFSDEEIKDALKQNKDCEIFLKMFEGGSTKKSLEIENDFIKKYGEEEYKKLYEECSRIAYEKIREKNVDKSSGDITVNNPYGYIYYINFPGVQSFINYFSNLKDISTASFMVDFSVSTLPFIYFDTLLSKTSSKTRTPLEALIGVSGGHSFFVGRSDVKPEEFIKEIRENSYLKDLDIELSISYKPFYWDETLAPYSIVPDLMEESQLKSISFEGIRPTDVLSYGLHKICDNCKQRPATKKFGDEYLCPRCYRIRSISNRRGFMARVNTTYKIGDKDLELEYREVDPMVFISGGDENPRYVSIIRFDANDASKYFANTLSWSEYLDKSFYLDYWIKKSLRDTVKEFISKNEKMTKRFIAGIQYLGGDEGLLISPSLISINFMIDMIDKVYEKTKVTFKVGIVTVKPDHPIQFAIQATEKIMEEAKIENKNSLGIIVSPSFISPSVIQGITEDEKKVLKLKNSFEDVKNIINMVNPDISEKDKANYERFKDFLREINDIADFYYTHSFYETLAYIIRERARHKQFADFLEILLEDYVNTKKTEGADGFRLLDLYFVLKNYETGYGEEMK